MKTIKFENSVEEKEAKDWNDFFSFITSNLDYKHFIWRGQRDSSWLLEPTLDRVLKKMSIQGNEYLISQHLRNFKYASRGRRGAHPAILQDENDWWALGQHHGLTTPLLDWSRSPFVAAYFAFSATQSSSSNFRSIYGLSQSTVDSKSEEIKMKFSGAGRPPIIEFIEPLSDENARLVNQNGLFTRSPAALDIESWVKKNFDGVEKKVRLWKINVPDSERVTILRSLNRMNINHLSLFPDLYGAAKFVNLDLEIDKY